MSDLETRELRYFLAVAKELHFGRAAERVGIAQPPLSRAIRQLERRLGVELFVRGPRGVVLTDAGRVLARDAREILDALGAAVRRTRRAGAPERSVVLATKAGASHELLHRLLRALATRSGPPDVEVLLCEVGEQARMLRDGRADIALMHRPVDDLAGLDTQDLDAEGQVAILPATHRLAAQDSLTMTEVRDVPDLPMARWPQLDGTYPPGPGPEVRSQAQISQLVALGRTLLVIPASSRAWQWPDHVAVPVTDAAVITTVLAWPPRRHTSAVAEVVRTAATLHTSDGEAGLPAGADAGGGGH